MVNVRTVGSRTVIAALVFALVLALALPAGAVAVTPAFYGVVTDADTTLPIEGVTVEAWQWDEEGEEFWDMTETNALGEYELYVAAGTYMVEAYGVAAYEEAWVEDLVFDGTNAVEVNFALEPLVEAFYGVVTDVETSDPIAEAWISAFYYDEGDDSFYENWAESNELGEYALYLPEGAAAEYELNAWAWGYSDAYEDRAWDGMTAVEVDFALERMAVIEIAGKDRYVTAVKASEATYPFGLDEDGALAVVIATGRNWPDALGGTSLAGVLDGPVLLVDGDKVPRVVLDEIERLGAQNAIILGGTSAVGTAAETALKNMLGKDNVTRVSGNNRYQTANEVAKMVIDLADEDFYGMAFVATGGNFPDAIAAAPLAAANYVPLFLSDPKTGLSSATKAAMAGVDNVAVLGGEAVVSASVYKGLQTTYGAENVTRLAGKNRYSTAAAVATFGVDELGMMWDGVGIATGENFPDALAGGVLQGYNWSVMLLTQTDELHAATEKVLEVNADEINTVTYFGGTNAVSEWVRDWIDAIIN